MSFDIVVFGATGFTGGLVARYLDRHKELARVRWALAGRNANKLRAVVDSLDSSPATIVVDATDDAALADLAGAARCVLSTVGPYADVGEPLVAACARAGTDYVDLCGEPNFVDRVVAEYGAMATNSGARLVNCCGFESVPHDLGTWLAVRKLRDMVGAELGHVDVTGVVQVDLMFSGGSFRTALSSLSHLPGYRRPEPPPTPGRRIDRDRPGLRRDERLGAWLCTFPTIDVDVVCRSARALPDYGTEFRYGHYLAVRSLPKIAAGAIAGAALTAVSQVGPVRRLLSRAVGTNTGPSPERRARAWFDVEFRAESGGRIARVRSRGGDPGYDESAKIIAECALCLALDEVPERSGALTPVLAMGDALVDRLARGGISFEYV